jgi:hypothetical protein
MRPSVLSVNPLIVLLLAVPVHPWGFGQTTGPENPPLVISSMCGRDLLEFYGATCHGRDGNGGRAGRVGVESDAHRSHDNCEAERRFVPESARPRMCDGRSAAARAGAWSKDMPVWGPIVRALDPNVTATRVRVANIVEYLESMQAK